MQHNNRWPNEPPLTGYTRSTGERRRLRRIYCPAVVSAAAVLGIAATAVLIVLTDSPARGAGDRAPVVVTQPTAQPGPPVPQPCREAAGR